MLDDLLHDGQPDAAAAGGPGRGPFAAEERLPDGGALAGRDAGALVVDHQANPVADAVEADRHGLFHGAVLHGVVQQVEEHLAERFPVYGGGCGRWQVRLDGGPPGRGQRLERADRLPDLGDQVHRSALHPVPVPVPAGSGEPQHVLHQVGQPQRLPIDVVQGPLSLRIRAEPAQAQRLQEEPDLGQWRPQLVGHAGHEIGAHAGQAPFPADLLHRDHREGHGQQQQAQHERQPGPGQPADDEPVRHLRLDERPDRDGPEVGVQALADGPLLIGPLVGAEQGRPGRGDRQGQDVPVLHAAGQRRRQHVVHVQGLRGGPAQVFQSQREPVEDDVPVLVGHGGEGQRRRVRPRLHVDGRPPARRRVSHAAGQPFHDPGLLRLVPVQSPGAQRVRAQGEAEEAGHMEVRLAQAFFPEFVQVLDEHARMRNRAPVRRFVHHGVQRLEHAFADDLLGVAAVAPGGKHGVVVEQRLGRHLVLLHGPVGLPRRQGDDGQAHHEQNQRPADGVGGAGRHAGRYVPSTRRINAPRVQEVWWNCVAPLSGPAVRSGRRGGRSTGRRRSRSG